MEADFDITRIARAWPFDHPPKRLVVKLGSNILSTPQGTLDTHRIEQTTLELARLQHMGIQVLVVTSGAVAAGMGETGTTVRPTNLPDLQALAAIGQCSLMAAWYGAFAAHGVTAAQVVLTRSDLEDRRRYLNARYTLESLLEKKAVPVINENDTVATDELTFGDNDMLSAMISATLSSELLVILTDTDGLYSGHPTKDPDARLMEVVERVTPDIEALAGGVGSAIGKGGMLSKVRAARHAGSHGIPVVIANGRRDSVLDEVLSGHFRGTLFLGAKTARRAGAGRARWISTRAPKGTLTIDDGACKALLAGGSSLLPVGVTKVEGRFEKGDVVSVRDTKGHEIARGISSFASTQVEIIKGRRAPELPEILGHQPTYQEVVHRDNLHVLSRE